MSICLILMLLRDAPEETIFYEVFVAKTLPVCCTVTDTMTVDCI